jgi:hypothetical protein
MVKNTIGGKKGKMLANKRSGSGGNHKLRLSSHPDEIFVCVSKVFGGGMFEVMDNQFNVLKAHLRGKMKGHNKRHNFVSLFSILLVGIRSDLSSSNECDILFVYDDHDVLSLSLLPNLNLKNILHFHLNHSFDNNTNFNDPFTNLNDSFIPNLNLTDTDTDIHTPEFDFNNI